MFQSFTQASAPQDGPPRLRALRALMAAEGVDAWIVPRADRFQGEYVAPCDERLAWLTGFTGSAGFAVITATEAGVFIDGRYRLQVRDQIAPEFTPVHWPETKAADWLASRLTEGAVLAFDPWLHPVDEVETLRARLTPLGVTLSGRENLVDRVWSDRPAPPDAPFTLWPEERAGLSRLAKLDQIAAALGEAGQGSVVLTLTDSVAWLFNIRGADVPRNPVPHAFALVEATGEAVLVAPEAKAAAIAGDLAPRVTLLPPEGLAARLATLPGPVRIDPRSAPEALRLMIEAAGGSVARGQDPCLLPKARKTPAELAGTTEAHLRDGAAVVRFLHWLQTTVGQGHLTEIDVVRALEARRAETNLLLDLSFDTICGAGPNGAIVHYRVTEATNRRITPGEVLLVDSGGQYLDGTTDITRTLATGPVPEGVAEAYTRVLQGLIAISRVRFPRGVTGGHLDSLARYPLWLAGQDYDHGTGHGVGVYLSVHEGPQRLSRLSDVALEPGMILSNEPGYYRAGAFGIRLENLIVVEEQPAPPGGDAGRSWLGFRTLTFAPFDRRLILAARLTPTERDFVDAYHAEVLARLTPRLSQADVRDWLAAACAPL